jgi:hypothetical protein
MQANSIVRSTDLSLSIGDQSPVDTTIDRSVPFMLELVDAVRARHVTPDISIYCIVAAEPYFAGFS